MASTQYDLTNPATLAFLCAAKMQLWIIPFMANDWIIMSVKKHLWRKGVHTRMGPEPG